MPVFAQLVERTALTVWSRVRAPRWATIMAGNSKSKIIIHNNININPIRHSALIAQW